MYTMMQACKETNMSYQALNTTATRAWCPTSSGTATTAASLTSTDVKWI